MARGRGGSHKGGKRHFTNPDELRMREERESKEREWRRQRGDAESSDEDEEDEEESDSEEETSSEEEGAKGGVQNLIEVENPNRVVKKVDKKVLEGVPVEKPKAELSRREREELEKQRAKEHYDKLHAEGKTEQARADLARLAIIKQQREEAAKKKELEKLKQEQASKTAGMQKVAATKSAISSITTASAPSGSSTAAKKKGNPRK